MATYVFLLIIMGSKSPIMQVTPMEDMSQCRAAIRAMDKAENDRSWIDTGARIYSAECVEVSR